MQLARSKKVLGMYQRTLRCLSGLDSPKCFCHPKVLSVSFVWNNEEKQLNSVLEYLRVCHFLLCLFAIVGFPRKALVLCVRGPVGNHVFHLETCRKG